jgi:hypothetical protein
VHLAAHLDQDIGEVIPYLNAALGGFQYIKDPPSVSFKLHGCAHEVENSVLVHREFLPQSNGRRMDQAFKKLRHRTQEY